MKSKSHVINLCFYFEHGTDKISKLLSGKKRTKILSALVILETVTDMVVTISCLFVYKDALLS